MLDHYDKRSAYAIATTILVADKNGAHRHFPHVLSSDDLLAELRRLRDEGETSNAAIQRLLNLPSSRVSEIFAGNRRIKADEAKVLVEHFGLVAAAGKQAPPLAVRSEADSDTVEIQNIDMAYGLGSTFADSPVDVDLLKFPKIWVESITPSPASFLTWTRGRGDSMHPTIDDGDLILLDRSQRRVTEQDALWAFTVGDTASIKRLRVKGDRFQILSDNSAVPPDEEPIDFVNIVARVVFVGKRK
jgi:hypothetical protein